MVIALLISLSATGVSGWALQRAEDAEHTAAPHRPSRWLHIHRLHRHTQLDIGSSMSTKARWAGCAFASICRF